MPLRVGLLGPLAVWDGDREIDVGRGRQRALLGLLALRANELVPVDRLIEELWSGAPPPTAQKAVQGYVSQLRRALGADAIVTHDGAYELRAASTDVRELDRARGRSALALWRGDPLTEFAYEPWAQEEIRRLDELHLVATEERIEEDLAGRGTARLVPELQALVSTHPQRERLRTQLMLALYRDGRQADALQAFAAARKTLLEDLGVEPGPALQEMQRRILRQDPELGPVARSHLRRISRRSPVLVAAGGLLMIGAALALAVALSRGPVARVRGDALALVSPDGRAATVRTSFGAPQSALAAGGDLIWTLGGQAGTITSIDARTHEALATFSIPARAIDLTFGAGAFWVLTQAPATILRLDPQSHAVVATIPLHGFDDDPLRHRPGQRSLAYARGSLFAIDGGGDAFRIDSVTRRIRPLALTEAVSVVAAHGSIWIAHGFSPGTAHVARVDRASGRVVADTPVPATVLSSFAVGGGALWVPDLFTGEVWQVREGAIRATSVGPGVSSVAFSNGAAWVGNEVSDTLVRIDPATARVTRVLDAPAPQSIAASSEGPLILTGAAASPDALPPSTCTPLTTAGSRAPKFIVASDLDFHGSPFISTTTSNAVRAVLRARGYRAGRYAVGYQACDDSSPLARRWDAARCETNATLYAKTRKVIGVVGPIDSGCAGEEVPILNQAPRGPVALVSPQATYDFLTRATPGVAAGMLSHLYPTHVRSFVRVIAPEAEQVAAAAVLARDLGLRRIAIVADDDGRVVTRSHVAWFRYAARRLHIATVVVSASAAPSARADGAFVASDAGGRAPAVVVELRARHHGRFPVIGTDYLTPTAAIRAAGRAADGTYVVTGSPVSKAQIAADARAAAVALLDAIASSDGTRLSVVRKLHASGRFLPDGDPVRGAVTVLRIADRSGVADPDFSNTVVDRVLTPPARIVHP